MSAGVLEFECRKEESGAGSSAESGYEPAHHLDFPPC
jgi:hypothetical protein